MAEENPLRPITKQWLEKIRLAEKHKKPFTEDAQEAMAFFASDPDAMWGSKYYKHYSRGIEPPEFKMQVNRVWGGGQAFYCRHSPPQPQPDGDAEAVPEHRTADARDLPAAPDPADGA